MTPAAIVPKLWNYCNVHRDDGMSYGDYVEQLTGNILGLLSCHLSPSRRKIMMEFKLEGRGYIRAQ